MPVASVGSAVPSASAETPPRSRRGVFLWEIGKNAPPAERAAELLASWGVGRVFIKSTEGAGGLRVAPLPGPGETLTVPSAHPWMADPPARRWPENASPAVIAAFAHRGIEVWVFGYFYPDRFVDPNGVAWGTLEQQAAMSLGTVNDDVAGVVVDAEAEFDDRGADATRLCTMLRAKLGKKKLAYTSFGWLTAHPRFPFKELDRGCGDAFMPQVYYEAGWPGGALGSLAKMRKDRDALGLTAPIWPIQSNERNPKLSDLQAFFDDAGPDASIFYMHPEGTPQSEAMAQIRF